MPKIKLISRETVQYAIAAIQQAPLGAVVTVLKAGRTNDQNAKMWAMLQDVSKAEPEGRQWTTDTWKAAFMHYLGHQVQFAEGLDGSGPFPIGFRTSKLSAPQMSDLIESMYEYGSRNGVAWKETKRSGFDAASDHSQGR